MENYLNRLWCVLWIFNCMNKCSIFSSEQFWYFKLLRSWNADQMSHYLLFSTEGCTCSYYTFGEQQEKCILRNGLKSIFFKNVAKHLNQLHGSG